MNLSLYFCRHGEPGGAGAGGARLPHALPPGVPGDPARDDEALLEEGPGREAHLRVPPVLPGGLLHRHRAAVPAWREPIASPDSVLCLPERGRMVSHINKHLFYRILSVQFCRLCVLLCLHSWYYAGFPCIFSMLVRAYAEGTHIIMCTYMWEESCDEASPQRNRCAIQLLGSLWSLCEDHFASRL